MRADFECCSDIRCFRSNIYRFLDLLVRRCWRNVLEHRKLRCIVSSTRHNWLGFLLRGWYPWRPAITTEAGSKRTSNDRENSIPRIFIKEKTRSWTKGKLDLSTLQQFWGMQLAQKLWCYNRNRFTLLSRSFAVRASKSCAHIIEYILYLRLEANLDASEPPTWSPQLHSFRLFSWIGINAGLHFDWSCLSGCSVVWSFL